MIHGEKSREEANLYIEKMIPKVSNMKQRRIIYNSIYSKFNIPLDTITDVFSFRKDIRELNNFEIFAVLYYLDRNALPKFFTEAEIENFSSERQESFEIKFPIIIEGMVQVAEDQWIGRTTLKRLMEFKDARLINYDENEQRTFRRIKSGNTEMMRIFINNKSVNEIKDALENEIYISDDITLNMPLNGSEFSYNESNYTLTITKLPNDKFNIIDGYHRWLSMSQIYNFNREFDYPMEPRIVNFSTEKAEQFIFQKDQKTLMKKVDSKTYNQYSAANKIIQRLNQNPMSNIQGMIGRNAAKIDMGTISSLIDYFFVREVENPDSSYVIETAAKLQNELNLLTENDPTLLKNQWSDRYLFIIIYLLSKDISPTSDIIEYLNNKMPDGRLFYVDKRPRRKIINVLDNAMSARGY